MKNDTPQAILLKNYKPVPYMVDKVELDFSLDAKHTRVTSHISMRPNPVSNQISAPLIFDGEKIKLISVAIDGVMLDAEHCMVSETELALAKVPQKPFLLTIVTECDPIGNTALSGLYMSNGMYCTQCEHRAFAALLIFMTALM